MKKEDVMKRGTLLVSFGMLVLLLSFGGYPAWGQSPLDAEIEAKIKGQESGIQEAVKAKRLTPADAKKLQDNLTNIRQQAGTAQSQGKMTAEQKNRFFQMLEKNNQSIESKKSERMKAMQQLTGQMKSAQGRAAKQQKLVDEGIKTNSLTQEEAAVLKANIENIKKEEARLQAEKKLTTEEQTRLFKMLDTNEAMIRDKQKNPVKPLFPTDQRRLGTTPKEAPSGKPGSGGR
jgi:septal ring factor EnvC (AmiA/AmiB activator)